MPFLQTLKKRELADGETQGPGKKAKKITKDTVYEYISPIRYRLPSPKAADYEPAKPAVLSYATERSGRPFYETSEHVFNRKGFRYTNAIVDPTFPSSRYHRASEVEPFEPRIDFKDVASHMVLDEKIRAVSTRKGFRMARANVGAREGRWYWECKVISGIIPRPLEAERGGGHVRIGWARREASLEGPVGFDAYSYGLRDTLCQKMHMSRPVDFADTDLLEGDVLGCEINLPSLSLHRKVVDGVYNKAVDVNDDLDAGAKGEFFDIIRDRVPIRYKTQLYFEQFEYAPTKPLEDFANPSPAVTSSSAPTATDPPNPNHPEPAIRTLPFSNMKFYKNGELLGTAFTDLFAFLPPASKPVAHPGAREGMDDGTLGYYPAISCFKGGAAEINCGPDFWCPPPELNTEATDPSIPRLRPLSERYNEQIAEDVTIDIVDEVDFWAMDGDETNTERILAQSILGPGDPTSPDVIAATVEVDQAMVTQPRIKEIVQEEE